MPKNPGARKAAKAAKRKAVVAAKLKEDRFAASKAGQILEATSQPFLHCLLADGLFARGMGTLFLSRGTPGRQFIGVVLLDTFALGIKDAMFRLADREEGERLREGLDVSDPMSPIAPEEARKLLRDLAAWSGGFGFRPHEDFAAVEPLFGSVVASDTDYRPRFGQDGQVMYLPGETESPALVRRRLESIRVHAGEAAAEASRIAIASMALQALRERDPALFETLQARFSDDSDVLEGEAEEVTEEPEDDGAAGGADEPHPRR